LSANSTATTLAPTYSQEDAHHVVHAPARRADGLNLVTGGLFAGLIAAVVAYVLWKERGPFIRGHVTTTLNFQITLIIAEIIGWLLALVIVGWFILIAAWVVNIIFTIQGALAASRGEAYTYPLSIRFFK